MRTTHTRISLLRLAVLYSFLPFFGLSLLINPGQLTSVQGQEQSKLSLSSSEAHQRGALKSLINKVKTLPATQANLLTTSLQVANTHLEMGQKTAACSDQQNFVNQVNALIRAKQLDSSQGQLLIDDISKIGAALGCSAFQSGTSALLDKLSKLFDQVQHRVLHPNATGGPDNFGYTFITNQPPGPTISSTFVDISVTGTPLVLPPCGFPPCYDNAAATAVLNQPFTFYGLPYNSLKVATNGYISTDTTSLNCNIPPDPNFMAGSPGDLGDDSDNDCPLPFAFNYGAPNRCQSDFMTGAPRPGRIYALHGDLFLPSATGSLRQQFFPVCPRTNAGGGTEPCTVIMWDNADFACIDPNTGDPTPCGTPFDFEVILFHTSSEIRVQVGPNPDHGAKTTTGIQNPAATSGLAAACNTPGSIPDNYAVSFILCTTITCPSNITNVPNTPGQCGANVNYSLPSGGAGCGTINCVPAPNSFFPVGTTTVNCTSSAGPTCMFTVTVVDTQAPTITCPSNISTGATSASGATVTYSVTATDNCQPPAPTVICVPPSGSNFPVGTTTVNCTASDASPNSPDAICSFTVTVNRIGYTISDPLACTGPGNIVNGNFTIPNTGGAPVTVTATATLPAGLIGQVGSCTANFVTTCTVSATTVSYTATIPVGQTASVNFQAQVADNVTTGTQLCSTLTVNFSGGGTATVQACVTVNCPAVGPGLPFPATGEVSDQKAGSVLVYNLYSSSIAAPNGQNTRISITNTNPGLSIAVHLFFVDGATCSIADSLVCLTPNQTASFLASDIDPGTTGYIVAVASDRRTGCPVDFNFLIGDEYVKLSSGHAANLAAEAFAALAGSTPICNALSITTQLNFDGLNYNRAPRVLAASNVPSRANGNDTLIVLNRLGGSLAASAGTLSSIFGVLYDDSENPLSFTFNAGVCQFRSSLSSGFPRTTPRFEQFIPAGRSGWAKFYSLSDIALLGAQINFNPNAGTAANAFNQGHNLHKLTLTTAATLTIPIFPPNC